MTNPASDVVVVGGGAIGCAAAYSAASRGLRVTLIDMPKRGRASSASAGGTWPVGESLGLGCGIIFYKALAKKGALRGEAVGPEQLPDFFLDFALQSNSMFPALAQELERVGGLGIEFEHTSLIFVMLDEADAKFARMLLERFPRDPSLLEWMTPEEANTAEPALRPDNQGGLRFVSDHQVNPYRFADALRAAARARGATTVTHTEVTGLRVDRDRIVAVETAQEVYPCGAVVNAAGPWAAEVGRMVGLDIPVRPVRGQIVCTETLPEVLSACISTSDCYIAQKQHGEIIIGSTTEEVDFDTTVRANAVRDLCIGAIRALPFLEHVRIKRVWCGLRPGTPDELPILGPVDGLQGYYNACGHFRTGILNAPLTGQVISEMILGAPASFECRPFLLSRFHTEPTLQPSRERKVVTPPKPTTPSAGGVGYSVRRYEGLLDLAVFVDEAQRISLPPGAVVVREQEAGDTFYVVVRGSVRVERNQRPIAHLGPGEFFGEMALLEDKPRSATVIVEADSELLVVPRDTFHKLLAEHPEIAATIMRVMASRLRAAIIGG